MKNILRVGVVSFLGLISVAIADSEIVHGTARYQELKIINKTNIPFKFMKIKKQSGYISNSGDLKPYATVMYEIGGKSAVGEIRYIDNKHNEVINFEYDYTMPGGKVTGRDSNNYYRYPGVCVKNGSIIFITKDSYSKRES